MFAGPAVVPAATQCPTPAARKRKAARRGAAVATFSGGGATTAEPAENCDARPATPKSTISPDRVPQDEPPAAPLRNEQGVPTVANPTTSLSLPGPVPVGVPNFFIDKFRIPPFLLPIYQAAGIQYGVRWEVLAAINEIETDYGRNLNISTAGALGWMQFMPQTWEMYGVDANRDGRKDPFNPVDAIFAAARYLKAAGADTDLRKAIFAYNHADWYVESVLMRARLIGGLPTDLVGSLSGLTQGHFPVFAKARYADDISERQAALRVAAGTNAANPVESDAARRGDRHLRRRRRPGHRRPGRARSPPSASPRAWAATSSYATPTATRTPTRTSRRSPRASRCRRPRRRARPRSPKSSRCPVTATRPRRPPRRRARSRARPTRP